jgi:hypothetical protein
VLEFQSPPFLINVFYKVISPQKIKEKAIYLTEIESTDLEVKKETFPA